MVRIQILSDGSTVGDVGRIIAYSGQTYSEPITFLYQNIPGTIKYVRYMWGATFFKNILDSNDSVSLHVHGAGRLNCQFIMEDAVTGEVKFKSHPFDLVIHESIENKGPNCFSNDYRRGCRPIPPKCDNDPYEMISKLSNELQNEEYVRASQDSNLAELIQDIDNKLNAIEGFDISDLKKEIESLSHYVDTLKGDGTVTTKSNEVAFGSYNVSSDYTIFSIGNGSSDGTRNVVAYDLSRYFDSGITIGVIDSAAFLKLSDLYFTINGESIRTFPSSFHTSGDTAKEVISNISDRDAELIVYYYDNKEYDASKNTIPVIGIDPIYSVQESRSNAFEVKKDGTIVCKTVDDINKSLQDINTRIDEITSRLDILYRRVGTYRVTPSNIDLKAKIRVFLNYPGATNYSIYAVSEDATSPVAENINITEETEIVRELFSARTILIKFLAGSDVILETYPETDNYIGYLCSKQD